MPFPEVAAVVGRTPAAVRQLAARARAHVADGAPRVDVADSQHQSTVAAFTRAATSGDLAGLLRVLDPDVVLTSDGGGVVSAARRPVLGSDKVARFVLGVAERPHVQATLRPALVNGAPGLVAVAGDRVVLVVSLTTVAGRIHRLDLVMAPDKLALVSLPGDV